jgi:hypothetical protein
MKKYILGSIAIALVMIASAFTIVAEKNNQKSPAATVWYYNGSGTLESDFQNGLNWNTTNVGTCVDEAPKPCHISADATTQAALSTYLSGFNKQAILNMSTGRKE